MRNQVRTQLIDECVVKGPGSVAKRTSLRVKQGAFGGLFEQNLCVEIVFIWFHVIDVPYLHAAVHHASSYFFYGFAFGQGCGRFVACCSLCIGQIFIMSSWSGSETPQERPAVWVFRKPTSDTAVNCMTLVSPCFLALPELIAILSTGYEVGVRDFLRGMEEASYDVMQLEILECLCRKPKRLFWWFFGVGFSYMLRRWFSHIQGDFNRWWFACQDFDRFDEIDLSRDDAESLRFCCFADLSREDYMY